MSENIKKVTMTLILPNHKSECYEIPIESLGKKHSGLFAYVDCTCINLSLTDGILDIHCVGVTEKTRDILVTMTSNIIKIEPYLNPNPPKEI